MAAAAVDAERDECLRLPCFVYVYDIASARILKYNEICSMV